MAGAADLALSMVEDTSTNLSRFRFSLPSCSA